jgi:hypothetical protein
MLLLDDWDELSESPGDEETALAMELGAAGLNTIDATLLKHTQDRWRKAARVVLDAVQAASFPLSDETRVRNHVRRLLVLADSRALDAKGNLRKPRWSEVRRLSQHG